MQVSPSQRQLVSGQVGWGWRQATYPISVNFGFAGLLILTLAIAQLVKVVEPMFVAIAICFTCIGFVVGLYTAKSIVEVCRHNSEYRFSTAQLVPISAYWLVLIAGLNTSLATSSPALIKIFVAIWWTLPAAIFIGISCSLTWRSASSKKQKHLQKHPVEAVSEDILSDLLNVVTYSDCTVLVSPSSLGQQPRQFNSLVLLVLGFFFWTMLDLSNSIRATAAIGFTATGLTGFFTWQAQLRSPEKILHLKFTGLWGIGAEYAIDLRPFSRLAVVKLQEANGEISWMQLAGGNSEITMPLTMTMFTVPTQEAQPASQNDQLGQVIRQEFHLAKQETERDSLGLANVLLPQGAGILAGSAFIVAGGLLLFIFPLPSQLLATSAIAWLGVCLVSPAIARFFLQLVATNTLQSDRHSNHPNHLQSWEIGTAILLISAFLSTQTVGNVTPLFTFNQALPSLNLVCGWLSISIGVCILAFVRRTPLWHNI